MNAHAKVKPHILTDTNQTAWQMASIQLTGVTSLPVLFGSLLIIEKISKIIHCSGLFSPRKLDFFFS